MNSSLPCMSFIFYSTISPHHPPPLTAIPFRSETSNLKYHPSLVLSFQVPSLADPTYSSMFLSRPSPLQFNLFSSRLSRLQSPPFPALPGPPSSSPSPSKPSHPNPCSPPFSDYIILRIEVHTHINCSLI